MNWSRVSNRAFPAGPFVSLPPCYRSETIAVLPTAARKRAPAATLRFAAMSDLTLDDRIAIPDGVVSRDLGGETVVLNLETGIYFDLDGVATDAWRALQRSASLQDVYQELLSSYDVEPARLSSDLLRLFQQMLSKGLVRRDG